MASVILCFMLTPMPVCIHHVYRYVFLLRSSMIERDLRIGGTVRPSVTSWYRVKVKLIGSRGFHQQVA